MGKRGKFCSVWTPHDKRLLERPRLRWEDQVRKNVQMVDLNADWHVLAMNRGKWHNLC